VSGRDRAPLAVDLEAGAYEELAREAAEREVSVEDLAAYAIAYFLADKDSGRLARRTLPPGMRRHAPDGQAD
jgi:hypothetical protein